MNTDKSTVFLIEYNGAIIKIFYGTPVSKYINSIIFEY